MARASVGHSSDVRVPLHAQAIHAMLQQAALLLQQPLDRDQ
jgi:hypothetical protein